MSKFKSWLEDQMPPSTNVSITNNDALSNKDLTLDTLLAIDQNIQRLHQLLNNKLLINNQNREIKEKWQLFMQSWYNIKKQNSHKNIDDKGLGSIVVPPGQEAMLKNMQPPPMPNTSGFTAPAGLNA